MEQEFLKLLPWATVTAMLAVVGVLVRVSLAYGKTSDAAVAAKAKADELERSVIAAERNLAQFRLDVAQTYVSEAALRGFRDEISASMTRLGDRLDRIIEGVNRRDSGRPSSS